MKINSTTTAILIFLLCLISIPAFAAGQGFGRQGRNSCPTGTIANLIKQFPLEAVNKEETTGLLHMYEEEKLARDVYSTLFDLWGQRVFGNIARSEQRHMEAVEALLSRYEITLPKNAVTHNTFESDEMQNLYNSLIEQGSKSLVDALLVGATIEDLDIYDLQERIQTTDNKDIQIVYQNLMRGSRNHMRSFSYQLTLNDATYVPKYLTKDEINNILSSGKERGGFSMQK